MTQALRDFRLGGVASPARAATVSRSHAEARGTAGGLRAEPHGRDRRVPAPRRVIARSSTACPTMVLERAKALATERGIEGWVLRLDAPTYQSVLSHAESAKLRETFYAAWVTRASDQGPHAGRSDNGPLIERDPRAAPRGRAARRLQDLRRAVARDQDGRLARARHRVPARSRAAQQAGRGRGARDARGLCRPQARALGHRVLFGAAAPGAASSSPRRSCGRTSRCRACSTGCSGSSAKLFDLDRRGSGRAERLASDRAVLRARAAATARSSAASTSICSRGPNKRGGAWMDSCVSRSKIDGSAPERPVAYLVCNFNPPVGETPSLLTHREAVTLFHEFGHALHHLLTEVDYPSIAGVNGVAWDAVELPSQFMENFVWRPEVLARHRAALSDRRAAAARQARHDEALAHVPRGARDGAPARVRAVRLPAASRVLARARRARARDPRRGAARGRPSCRSRATTAFRTRSRTSSAAATPRATTATSGPRCSRRTRSRRSRSRACSTAPRPSASAARS